MSAYEHFDKAAVGTGFLPILWATSWTSERLFSGTSPRTMRTEPLWPQVTLVGTGAISLREAPDHLDIIVRISSGAPVLVQILANAPAPDAHHTPGFGHDVHNGCLTARVQQAARTGRRQS